MNIFHNYILDMMQSLVDQDIDPNFSAFQNTVHWKTLRQSLPLSQQRGFIIEWDTLYKRLDGTLVKPSGPRDL